MAHLGHLASWLRVRSALRAAYHRLWYRLDFTCCTLVFVSPSERSEHSSAIRSPIGSARGMALKAVDTPERLTRSGRVRKHRSRHLRPKSPKSALTHNSLIPPTPGLDGATSLTARRPLTRSLTGQRPPDSGVPTASLALSAADGIGNGSAFTTGGYLITPAPSDDPFRRLSPRGFRYQLRSNPTMPNPENATPPLTLDVESMDDEIAAPPTEEERLMAELKEKNKTIRTLKRKLAAINKVNAKHESAKLHRQRILENQKRKLKQSEKAQRIAETKATELEKSHRKLRFEKYVDEEVRKQLAAQSKEFQEIWEVAEQKMFEKRFEELKKAVGCDVIVTRVHPAASEYQRTEDLRGIHSSMMAQLKQVHSVSGKCNPTKIEYILNDELYHRYKETKAKLEAAGHPVDEMLIFHGTREDNIDAYDSS